jgi:hypothetical protein
MSPTAVAESWAERLGYPADKKVVILHMHGAGLCYESNAAVAQLLSGGLVRSASAMAPSPWFGDFAQWRRHHQDADVGLELTLNSELQNYRWHPVSPWTAVPSLVDGDGYLCRSVMQTMVNASVEDVELELLAQMHKAESLGLRPTHLTTHLGALFTRLELAEAYLAFARRHWIPAVVVELTPERLEEFRSQGYPLPPELVQLVTDYPLPKVDELQIMPSAETFEEKKATFLALFNRLPAGLTQIAFAAAQRTDALAHMVDDAPQRGWELELFLDEGVQQRLRQDDIILTDWQEVMSRFEGRSPIRRDANASENTHD